LILKGYNNKPTINVGFFVSKI